MKFKIKKCLNVSNFLEKIYAVTTFTKLSLKYIVRLYKYSFKLFGHLYYGKASEGREK